MANVIKTTLQFRRDLAENWAAVADRVIPAAGEPCFETDTGVFKIGDGVKTYGELDPISGAKISADGKSIIINGEGALELAGFADAEANAQPRKKADGTIEWVVPSTETVDGLQTTIAGLQADLEKLEAIVTPSEEGAIALDERVAAIEEILNPTVEEGEEPVPSLLARVEGLEGGMTTLNGDATVEGSIKNIVTSEIDAFATKVSDDKIVNTLKELVDYVADHGPAVDKIVGDISELQGLVGKKVDAEEGKSLISDTLIAKLETLNADAQANVIESITAGGTLLAIVNKTIDIPVASTTTLGLVKSYVGDEYNKVVIAEDGTMSVNKIDVSALYVPEDSELVLDGGSSATLDGGGAAG
jgi:hypothetical protein